VIQYLENSNNGIAGNELKKFRNKKNILRLLYINNHMTATALGKELGISFPTVMFLLNDLLDSGLIEIRGIGSSRGGRKPLLFGLCSNSSYVVACDMGRYEAKISIFNCLNQQIAPFAYLTTSINDDQMADKIHTAAMELIRKHSVPMEKIVGFGLDMPGLVDTATGINYTIQNRQMCNVRKLLEERFKIYVYVDNDARMQAYGEYIFGKAKSHGNAIVVNWSWGLGLGLILNGLLYTGNNGFSGEFSHILMEEDGDLCICGKRGCLETVASANTLLKLAREGIKEGCVSQLTQQYADKPEEITPETIISAARSGDEFSIAILNRIALSMGRGLSLIIQLINPGIIVLGGSVSTAGKYVMAPIQQSLNRYCLESIYPNTQIVHSEIWQHAGLLGLTAKIYEKIFIEL
jgi:N-acetylglucosamine repressor